jgi:hypothetical protein
VRRRSVYAQLEYTESDLHTWEIEAGLTRLVAGPRFEGNVDICVRSEACLEKRITGESGAGSGESNEAGCVRTERVGVVGGDGDGVGGNGDGDGVGVVGIVEDRVLVVNKVLGVDIVDRVLVVGKEDVVRREEDVVLVMSGELVVDGEDVAGGVCIEMTKVKNGSSSTTSK